MPQIPGNNQNPDAAGLSPEEKKQFNDIAKFLSRAIWQAQAFGIEHPLTKQPLEQCFSLLDKLIQNKGSIILYIAERNLRYGDNILEDDNPVVDRLVDLFTTIKLTSIEFQKGFTHQDFLSLLSILALRSQDILDQGGIEKLVGQKNISYLKLNPIKYELIGKDKKVVSEEARFVEGDILDLEKKLSAWEIELGAKEEEKKSEDELLALIDSSLKEETDQSVFVNKLIKDPLEEVHLIIEAIHLVNKIGGEKAKAIVSMVVNKLDLVRDDLYQCLVEGKEDEHTDLTYRSAEILGKELTRQIKALKVSPDLNSKIEEMTNVLSMIMDQAEAKKLLNISLKGEFTLKKKANLLTKIMHRKKTSPDFEFLMKKILTLKGMPEDEVSRLFAQQEQILEMVAEEKEESLTQDLEPTLQQLAEKQINTADAISQLNEVISRSVEVKLKSATRKLQQDNEKLAAQTEAFNHAFGDIEEGVMVFDDEEKVVFINEVAKGLVGLQANDKMDKQLFTILKNLQADKAISLEALSKENAEKKDLFSKIISQVKVVKRSEKGKLNIAIFKPLP